MHSGALLIASPSRQKLVALSALVLGVHLWLLLTSGESLWRLHSESQKLGPLQTRVIQSVTPTPPANTQKFTDQVRFPAKAKPKPPQAALSAETASPAELAAVASAALPEPLPVSNESASNAANELPSPFAESAAPPTVAEKAAEAPAVVSTQDNALVAKSGSFPDNVQINYTLTGQERGLNYYASGALKWQVNSANSAPRNYEAELRVRAFLVGSRVWRSQGELADQGLAPQKYTDSWRGERAAHFDAVQRKISFSANTPSAEMQAGAQDQVSLFIQMAAATAAQNFTVGSVLNVQTATARDAVNWRLTYKSDEPIDIKGARLETQRWVCLPRGKFDSQIEMWLSKSHGGMPVRIKITQVNGNFIDMEMNGTEALPPMAD